MRTGNPGHVKTFSYTGLHRYFLTFCTDRRRPVFANRAAVDLVRDHLMRVAIEQQFAVFAYCFMPDHLHLLIEAQSDASECLRFISRAKQFSGFYYSKAFQHRLWQRYGYEHTLRDGDEPLVVARYILENPVRAGLVDKAEDYPFSGSETFPLKTILEAVGELPVGIASG
jgi:putative transposase